MPSIGTQIYLIGFCVPIQGTQEEKINGLQKPCLPRFGTHLHNHTSMKNITYAPKANDPDQRTGKHSWTGAAVVQSNG